MNERKLEFCRQYLTDFNAAAAAVRAGCSPNIAAQWSAEVLHEPETTACLNQLRNTSPSRITADRVAEELAKIAFVSADEIIDSRSGEIRPGLSPAQTAAVSKVKVKITPSKNGEEIIEREISLYDKIKVLELLGKHVGLFQGESAKKERVVIVDDIGADHFPE